MDRSREVVITGVGVVSPIGIGREAFWTSLCAGRSGVATVDVWRDAGLPVQFGGLIRDFDPRIYVKPRKALKVMCRELQTSFAAYALAVEDARLDPGQADPARVGVVFGSEMFFGEPDEFTDLMRACAVDGQFDVTRYASSFASQMYPLWMLKNLPNMPACHVAIAQDAQGPCNTIVLGEVSGLLAMIEATRCIQRGAADVMLVGSVGTRVGLTSMLYRSDELLSHRNDDPAGASRPFDRDRDGLVNGEGAAVVVLESRAHAMQRCARVLVRCVSDHLVMARDRSEVARSESLQRLVRETLSRGFWSPEALGHINAHGASGRLDDALEARALAQVCPQVPVTALKSYFGHTGAGCGLLELAASILALEHDQVPSTLNYHTPDPLCPLDVIHDRPRTERPRSALKLSMSPTGQAAAVLIHREA